MDTNKMLLSIMFSVCLSDAPSATWRGTEDSIGAVRGFEDVGDTS